MSCDSGREYFTASDAKPIKFFNPVVDNIPHLSESPLCLILDWSIG